MKKMIFLAGCLAFILAQVAFFNFTTNKRLSFAYAAEVMRLRQEITPFNPVEKAESAKKVEKDEKKDTASDNFRMIVPLEKEDPENRKSEFSVVKNPIITFSGKSIYPNSEIILEIHSEPFITSTKSDGQGNWTWTNFGHPLENGGHVLKAYSISAYELSGQRDIFLQQYAFQVESDGSYSSPAEVSVEGSDLETKNEEGELGERFLGRNGKSVYSFNTTILNKNEFKAGEEINLELIFNPLKGMGGENAKISYLIYSEENSSWEDLVFESSDELQINGSTAFLKTIKLKEMVVPGSYILKTIAETEGDKYVQSNKFKVRSSPVVQVGSVVVTEDRLALALIVNIMGALVFSIVIVVIMALEFRRFIVYGPVDEGLLKKKHYF